MSQTEPYEVPRSEEQWRKLLAFLPAFEDPKSDPGGWAGGELIESGARTMPYAVLPDVLHEFVQTAYDEGFMFAFDCIEWVEQGGQQFIGDAPALSYATLDDLRRAINCHIRADRFVEGHLLAEYRAGTLAALLRRASALIYDERS